MSPEQIDTTIAERLQAALAPTLFELRNDSAAHHGHAGAVGGAQHYQLTIASAQLDGLRKIAQHRLIYGALHDLMPHWIHALSIEVRETQAS